MPARFGTGGSRGRRITGDDMPLYAHPEEIGKGLIPSFSALKTSAKTVGPMKTAGAVGSMVKPKIQSGFNAATATRNRTLATGGTAGLATGALMSPRQKPQTTTANYFGKAREYDYDRNRNRRLGAAEASLVLGGGYAGHKGIQGTRADTKRLRDTKIRTAVGGKDKSLGEVYGRRALAISRRNALLIGGGAAAIGAAGGVHQWGNSNKGRVWR